MTKIEVLKIRSRRLNKIILGRKSLAIFVSIVITTSILQLVPLIQDGGTTKEWISWSVVLFAGPFGIIGSNLMGKKDKRGLIILNVAYSLFIINSFIVGLWFEMLKFISNITILTISYILWSKPTTKSDAVKNMPVHKLLLIMISGLIATAALGLVANILKENPSAISYLDAFVFAFTMIAFVLVSKKYRDSYLIFFLVNLVAITMYISVGQYSMASVALIYLLIDIAGIINWTLNNFEESNKKFKLLVSLDGEEEEYNEEINEEIEIEDLIKKRFNKLENDISKIRTIFKSMEQPGDLGPIIWYKNKDGEMFVLQAQDLMDDFADYGYNKDNEIIAAVVENELSYTDIHRKLKKSIMIKFHKSTNYKYKSVENISVFSKEKLRSMTLQDRKKYDMLLIEYFSKRKDLLRDLKDSNRHIYKELGYKSDIFNKKLNKIESILNYYIDKI